MAAAPEDRRPVRSDGHRLAMLIAAGGGAGLALGSAFGAAFGGDAVGIGAGLGAGVGTALGIIFGRAGSGSDRTGRAA